MIIPIAAPLNEYAQKVCDACTESGFYAEVDLSGSTLNKKVRNAEIAQYNFIFVVGAEEMNTDSVNVRCRDDVGTKAKTATIPITKALADLTALRASKSLVSKI